MKPILFNTQMVQAILEGRKTVTRRLIKTRHENTHIEVWDGQAVEAENDSFAAYGISQRYGFGDILYVRETWAKEKTSKRYLYRADEVDFTYKELHSSLKWKPSIHMPKEAARIFLRVTNVSVARLQDITEGQAIAEGAEAVEKYFNAKDDFKAIWDSTLKGEINQIEYSWDANPYVWVIEFERIYKPNV